MNSAKTLPSIDDPTQANPELVPYYGNRPLMWRNMFLILLLNLGWQLVFTVINPLMAVHLKKMGVSATGLGWIGAINMWAYSYLVMYSAWKSDHTVSRWGRRLPFLFICSPIIIVSTLVFPFIGVLWALIVVYLVQLFFTDIKQSVIPLLQIDCMPRRMLARCNVPFGIIGGLISFASFRYGTQLADTSEVLPYVIGAIILVGTTVTGGLLIKEPPVRYPTDEIFKPWSAMRVAWKDKRKIIIMVAYGFIYMLWLMGCNWSWLYGIEVIGLTRTQVGSLMAWTGLLIIPSAYAIAWLVDRFSPYHLLPLLFLSGAAMFGSLWWYPTYYGFVFYCCVSAAIYVPLHMMVELMVYRDAPAEDMGAVTSTNSCLKGISWGICVQLSGWLIDLRGKDYRSAFALGFVMTCFGLVLAYIYGWTMRRGRNRVPAASVAEPAVSA